MNTEIDCFTLKFFEEGLSQLEKINKMEELFINPEPLTKEQLTLLINLAIDKKDIHVLGYCLALETQESSIEDKERLFLKACQKEFVQGMQLLSSHIDLNKEYTSTRHPGSIQSLLNHSLTYVIEHTNPKQGIRFLLNKGADLSFGNNQLFKYAYENNFKEGMEYLIKGQNLKIDINDQTVFKDATCHKLEVIKKWIAEHEYEVTQNHFVMKELPANVTRRKV